MTDAVLERLEGPAPAVEVASDLARRGVVVAPLFVAVGAILGGTEGAASAGFALGLVVVNFLFAAAMLGYAGRISFALMGGAAMFGFLIRLGLIFGAFWLVKDAGWFDPVAFGVTIIVSHLGLLFWEMRYISSSLAYPGLKPGTPKRSTTR